MSEQGSAGILAGYRVLELTTTVAGPFCGRLLADFGAEVIKVEPPRGDELRAIGRHFEGKSLYAASLFRNKSLIALDWRSEAGQEVVRRLARQCHIVVENFRPGTLERWNLGYEALSEHNPGLVMVRISSYGQTGPYRDRPGYGVVAEAVSGLRQVMGEPDLPPTRVAIPLTDYITGLYGAFGAVMALLHSQRTGVGQVVDAALYEGGFSFMEPAVPAFQKLGMVPMRAGSRMPGTSPNNLYVTRDGGHLLIAAVSQAVFGRLATAMGRPDLADDPRFATGPARTENDEALDAIVAQWCGERTLEELEAILHDAEVPATRIFSIADIFANPHYQARDMLVDVPDEEWGSVKQVAPVPRFSRTPGRVSWSGRNVGQDTVRILTAFGGYSEAEAERLREQGVVFFDSSAAEKTVPGKRASRSPTRGGKG